MGTPAMKGFVKLIGDAVMLVSPDPEPMLESTLRLVEIEVKYSGYLHRERDLALQMEHLESWQVPNDLDYSRIETITHEAREKLSRIQPENLGQASRISGVTPAAVLGFRLRRRHWGGKPKCGS